MSDKLETCKNCRWWDGNKYSEVHKTLLKYTKPDPDYSEVAYLTWQCTNSKMVRGYGVPESKRPLDGAVVECDEGWGIETGPDFGCIHWETKLPL